eukprot:1142809-Ditylum_brightwellii.AAC.1
MEVEFESSDLNHYSDDVNRQMIKDIGQATNKQDINKELKEDEHLAASIIAIYDYFLNIAMEERPDIKLSKFNPK